jgi:L-cysteine:1D-myo-inositol 2-amino-2-deoxy-alpha-D-glucopyranoside ligase
VTRNGPASTAHWTRRCGCGPSRTSRTGRSAGSARAALGGLPIDIQGGGTDLIFPHHEISRQQAVSLAGQPLATGYMHVGMLRLGGEKMSKSLGNLVLVPRLLADGHSAAAIRLALLTPHYRTELDWEPELLDAAAQRLARWQQASALTAAPPFDGVAAAATGHLACDLDTGSAIDVLDAWCEQALAGPAGDAPADPAAPAAFTGYLSGVLGLPLRETGRPA